MNFLNFFFPKATYATGALPQEEDYRDIQLGYFQKPLGAPPSYMNSQKIIAALEVLDQLKQPACVPHVMAHLLSFYIYMRFVKIVNPSPRFGYKLCKLFDAVPQLNGTYQRIGALVFTKIGCAIEDLLKNDTSLSKEDYLAFEITKQMLDSATNNQFPGFAFVEPNIEAIKEAIYQNDAIAGCFPVGNFDSLPVKPNAKRENNHDTIWYGYESFGLDTKIYFKNSWGKGWMAKIKNWLFPGHGYFLWSDFKPYVFDIVAFTAIPYDYFTKTKTMPYKFTKELKQGDSGLAVLELQKMINSEIPSALQGPGSPKEETTYFGPATAAALIKWQKYYGIKATGYFGPLSIAQANKRILKTDLYDALVIVESGGMIGAIGDRNLANKAYGPLQIRQPYIEDVNKLWKTSYKAQDCLNNLELSLKVTKAYISLYATVARLGRPVTDEDRARIHNGGPDGYKKPSTIAYWAKVKNIMQT